MFTVPPGNGPTSALVVVGLVAVVLTALGTSASDVRQLVSGLVSLAALYVVQESGERPK